MCMLFAESRQWSILVTLLKCRFLDTEVDVSYPGISMLCPLARHFIRIALIDPLGTTS